jgi:hypothetical protein
LAVLRHVFTQKNKAHPQGKMYLILAGGLNASLLRNYSNVENAALQRGVNPIQFHRLRRLTARRGEGTEKKSPCSLERRRQDGGLYQTSLLFFLLTVCSLKTQSKSLA